MTYYSTTFDSPLGKITLASDSVALNGLWIEGQPISIPDADGPFREDGSHPVFKETEAWLKAYFDKKCPSISHLPLAPVGNEFRQCVWQILKEIPYGEVVTYGDVAKEVMRRLNKPAMSAQAVGGAVGHNPISIIIPCHRVIGQGKRLTGYAGGIDKKIYLLTHEGVEL